jgi:hypothetical protein
MLKWKKRSFAAGLPTGPRKPKSSVLSVEEEAMAVTFRRHTLLPLDDCLCAPQATIPHLTRSSLHRCLQRCLQRHGISRLPEAEGDKPAKKKFKSYPIGFFHIDIAEVRTKQGKLYLFAGIDRTSTFAFVQLHEQADRPTAAAFLEALIAAAPYRLHTILTGNPHRQSSPAMASNSLTCLATATAGRRAIGFSASTRFAASPASSTGSLSRTIPGRIARSSE